MAYAPADDIGFMTTGSSKGQLLRILGVGFGIAVTIGGTLGVGILRTPGMVAGQIGHGWLILAVWLAGGFYALCCTISVVELAVTYPTTGGWYVYARRAFGPAVGFSVGWGDWLGQSAALAYLATAMGEFSVALIPGFLGVKTIAVATLTLFAILHWFGLRLSSRAQEVTSLAKAVAFLALIGACLIADPGPSGSAFSSASMMPHSAPAFIIALFIALQSVVITYDGYYSAIYFTEEDRDPANNLPRSAIGGMLLTIGIFLLLNAALLRVLSLRDLSASILPAADAIALIAGSRAGQIITLLSIISLPSVINAVLLIATRILYALSRDGLFSGRWAAVNPAGTPVACMLASTTLGIALILSGTFEKLVAVAAIVMVFVYGSGFLSLLVLRKHEPNLPRPYRAWGYPWTPLIALVFSGVFLSGSVVSDPPNSFYAIALIGVSYPVYRIWGTPHQT